MLRPKLFITFKFLTLEYFTVKLNEREKQIVAALNFLTG